MTLVQFLNPDKYAEAYWYCRLYLKTSEWSEDFTLGYALKFVDNETATYVKLVYG